MSSWKTARENARCKSSGAPASVNASSESTIFFLSFFSLSKFFVILSRFQSASPRLEPNPSASEFPLNVKGAKTHLSQKSSRAKSCGYHL
ncbi:MAG: hypothetical protein AB1468_02500 [Candidatus Micrarchaeota archaeon]